MSKAKHRAPDGQPGRLPGGARLGTGSTPRHADYTEVDTGELEIVPQSTDSTDDTTDDDTEE